MSSYLNFGHALAGAVAYVTSMTICYPLDTVRSILQVENGRKGTGTFKMIKEIIYKDGIGRLYQGLRPVLITIFTSNFIYFYTYQGLKSVWTLWVSDPVSASGYLIIATIAGAINVLATNPLWVVNTRMRLQGVKLQTKTQKDHNSNCEGIISGIINIAKTEGARGLWRGAVPSLLLVINPGIQFMVYEVQKKYTQTLLETNELHALAYFTMGAIAKMVATFCTYPLQIVQTRLRFYKPKTKSNPFFDAINMLLQLLKVGGFKSWYQGMEAKLWQTIITTALMFAFYEKLVIIVFYIMNLEINDAMNKEVS